MTTHQYRDNRRHRLSVLSAAFVTLLGLHQAFTFAADSGTPAELLQQGIYQEETAGNLSKAQDFYRQAVEQGNAVAAVAAEAQYRLAMCLLKDGKKDEATEAFRIVIRQFGDQTDWVAKARIHVDDTIRFEPAAYPSGIRETLEMKLPGGLSIGMIGCGAEKVIQDGREVWRYYVRRFVGPTVNEGASRMDIDAATMRPISTTFEHCLLGDASAEWSPNQVKIHLNKADGTQEDKTIDLESTVYCNDQWFYNFRQLPLAIGYEQTLPLRVAFTGGSPIGLEVSVKKKETIETELGSFECFRLDTNIGQTFWITDTPERHMVRFEGGGVNAELTNRSVNGEARALKDDRSGLEAKMPQGWFAMMLPSPSGSEHSGFMMASTTMASSIIRVRDGDDEQSDVQAWVAKDLKKAAQRLKEFKETEPAKPIKLGRIDAVAVAGTFRSGSYVMKRRSIYAFHDGKALQVHHSSIADQFDSDSHAFDQINDSLSL